MRADRDSGGGVADRGRGRPGSGWLAAIALWTMLGAPPAPAVGTPQESPDPVLMRIDFEYRETATADWSHVFEQAPGLPRRSLFFDAVVDETVASAGGSSLRLHLEG